MIKCPSCQASLPAWATVCQFCKADVSKVARPAGAPAKKTGRPVASWIWGAYYSLAAFYVLSGIYDIAMTFVRSKEKFMGEEIGLSFFSYIGIAIGAITALVGLGLIFRVELARGVVNFLCGLQIIFGLFGLAGAVLGTLFSGALGFVLVIMQVVQIAAAGFMIYVIGETDRVAPNL
jgi:hypothetical protein